jgi:hypothetical protein
VLSGFSAAAGYDLATGLGSVNVANLVKNWTNVSATGKATTTTLTAATNPPQSPINVMHGTPISVTVEVASVQAGGGTPTGNVALIAATGPSGEEGITNLALTNGAASGATNLLPGGTYNITAYYPGDGIFAASGSTPPISVTVNPEAGQAQVEITTLNPTTGQITGKNATSVPFGSPYVLDINVTGKSGATCAQNSRGEGGCATGTVTLTDNGTSLDGSPAGSGTFALNPAGSAEDKSIQLLAGTHNLVASYSGDVSFTKVTSPTDVVTVTKANTSTALSGPPSEPFGLTPVSYNISVTTQSNSQNVLPSGSVTFFNGTTSIGTLPVGGFFNFATGSAAADGFFTLPSLNPGQYVITAQYSGDSNYATSASPNTPLTILFTTTTTVTVSSLIIQEHQSVTITAQVVSNQPGGPAIGGSVEFLLAGMLLGTSSVSNGQAQLTVSPSMSGNGLSALYLGDANYNFSNGFVDLQVTAPPDFSMSTNPGTITISSPGATGTTAITIAAQNGFTGMVTFACSGLPAESSCNAPAVNGSGTTTLSILTTAPSMTVPLGRPNNIGGQALARLLFVIAFCVCGVVVLIRRRKQRWITALALIALASVVAMSACGGGGGGGTGPTNPGTPTGIANVTVTATGTMNGATTTHTVPVTVNVL